jgi:hypothetical protein
MINGALQRTLEGFPITRDHPITGSPDCPHRVVAVSKSHRLVNPAKPVAQL